MILILGKPSFDISINNCNGRQSCLICLLRVGVGFAGEDLNWSSK